MSKPLYKKGDIIKHVLTKDEFLVMHPVFGCDCKDISLGQMCFKRDICDKKEKDNFSGVYLVMDTGYQEREFPEWQLMSTVIGTQLI